MQTIEEIRKKEMQKELEKICVFLQSSGYKYIPVRDIEFQLSFGSGKVDALRHGRNGTVKSYYDFYSFLFSNQFISIMPEKALEILKIALVNGEDLAICRVDKSTHKIINDFEIIVKHECSVL